MGKACAHAGVIWTLRTNAARQPRTPHHGTSDMIRQRRLEGPRGCCALGAPPHACHIACVHHSLSRERGRDPLCGRRGRSVVPHAIHRWLADLEHTACGLRRPHVVRGWQEVTCQRCLGSIHAKLAQLQRQQPASYHEPQGHLRQGGEAPGRRAAALRAARRRARSVTARVPQGTWRACAALPPPARLT